MSDTTTDSIPDFAQNIKLSDIRTDGGTQMRAELDSDVYFGYRDLFRAGVDLPPLDVFHDGSTYWLADGFHRFYGAREAKLPDIKCNVHQGTVRNAILFACGANQAHGLRRSNADKRNSVEALLNDESWVLWSDNRIADTCGVSQNFVSEVRKQLTSDVSSPAAKTAAAPKEGRDGKKRRPKAKVTPVVVPLSFHVEQVGEIGDCPHGGDHVPDADGDCTRCFEPGIGKPLGWTLSEALEALSDAVAKIADRWPAEHPNMLPLHLESLAERYQVKEASA